MVNLRSFSENITNFQKLCTYLDQWLNLFLLTLAIILCHAELYNPHILIHSPLLIAIVSERIFDN